MRFYGIMLNCYWNYEIKNKVNIIYILILNDVSKNITISYIWEYFESKYRI